MQFMSRNETGTFLGSHKRGPTPKSLDLEFQEDGFYQTEFRIPTESGPLLSLLRHLFNLERVSSWTMIIMESAGIWPSWEDRNLTEMMRRARGALKQSEYGEGHLFSPGETADMISFAYVFANFRYDFRILDSDREIHAFFSHDDFFYIQMAEKFADAIVGILDFTEEWPEKK